MVQSRRQNITMEFFTSASGAPCDDAVSKVRNQLRAHARGYLEIHP